jgi:hypothetical protein
MSTSSVTKVIELHGREEDVLVTMYRHYDGYMKCHGKELYDFLKETPLIKNLGIKPSNDSAYGAGCLAAKMVANFKKETGYVFLVPEHKEADYFYNVFVYEDNKVRMVVSKGTDVIFNKLLEEIDPDVFA